MNYSLHIAQSAPIACADHEIQEIFYTARTLSKYNSTKVDVYRGTQYVTSFMHGRRHSDKRQVS